MKSLIFLSLMILFLFPASLLSQDQIILETGEEIECKIVEISTMEVKYMLYAQKDSPVITVPRSDVRHIEYHDITKNAAEGEEKRTVSGPTSDRPKGVFNIKFKLINENYSYDL